MSDNAAMPKHGAWPQVCVQRAFCEGFAFAIWREFGWTLFPTEREAAEAEAVKRYGEPSFPAPPLTGSGEASTK